MEGCRIIFVVHLYIPVVFADCFPYAFYAESMLLFIGFGGEGHTALEGRLFRKRVTAAGVGHGYDDKGSIFFFLNSHFYRCPRDARAGFHGIIEQIAEQRGDIIVSHKIYGAAPDISEKRYLQREALFFIAAEDRV